MANDLDLDELRSELADFAPPEKKGGRSPREERIVAGFEEIQRFVEQNGRVPQHGEGRDIFERLYAVRLDRLRELEDCRSLLVPLDHQGLLAGAENAAATHVETMDDDELLAELEGAAGASDITELRHVRTSAEKRAAEEIANRQKCEDFDRFRPLFKAVQDDLETGVRITRQIRKDAGFLKTDIKTGEFFILGGQIAYVAEVGEPIKAPNGETDARLRVIYSNGTESDLLLRSLQRALYKEDASRRISEPTAGPLFSDIEDEDDLASGTVYVLRSKSDHPVVAQNRDVFHKIGVTGGSVQKRIANAEKEATYLLAGVEVVATYELYNINRTKLEKLIHRVFGSARLDIDTTTPAGRLVSGFFAALAEFERELIVERTVAGLSAARARGRNGGRPYTMTAAKLRLAQTAMTRRETRVGDLCKELGVTRQTLYRFVAPDGTLRADGEKRMVLSGEVRSGSPLVKAR